MKAWDFSNGFRDACYALCAAIFWGLGIAIVFKYALALTEDSDLKFVFLPAAALIAVAMWRYRSRIGSHFSGHIDRNTGAWEDRVNGEIYTAGTCKRIH